MRCGLESCRQPAAARYGGAAERPCYRCLKQRQSRQVLPQTEDCAARREQLQRAGMVGDRSDRQHREPRFRARESQGASRSVASRVATGGKPISRASLSGGRAASDTRISTSGARKPTNHPGAKRARAPRTKDSRSRLPRLPVLDEVDPPFAAAVIPHRGRSPGGALPANFRHGM